MRFRWFALRSPLGSLKRRSFTSTKRYYRMPWLVSPTSNSTLRKQKWRLAEYLKLPTFRLFMLRQHQKYWTMKLLSEICMFTVLLATLAAASDDDGIDSTDEKADEGGTPIYDWSHHRWGSAETLTSSFLLVFIGLFGFSVVSSYYIGHVVRCTLFPEVTSSANACAIRLLRQSIHEKKAFSVARFSSSYI